jgi:ABC-type nitrate/sulfonate/bicarbonate transport system permease component
MSFIAMIGALGYLCDRALRALSHRLTPWAPETAASR